MVFHGEGIGGAVFLTLYTINLSILLFGFFTRRISIKSVYAFLLLHVLLRLGAQTLAIIIGTKENLDFGLLIAFFVLGAEGYFSLVLCSYRFVIHHHQHTYPTDGSWLEGKPKEKKKGREGRGERDEEGRVVRVGKKVKRAMTARDDEGKKDPWVMTIIHWTLIGANVIIIYGGTMTNGSNIDEPDYYSDLHKAKILRSVGQAIFLTINLFLAIFIYLSIKQDRNPSGTLPLGWTHFFRVKPNHGSIDAQNRLSPLKVNPTLIVLIVAWPPLIIRGIFGLLQGLISHINYANPDAYHYDVSTGNLSFSQTFVILENIFSVLPEWFACCLLVSTIFTRKSYDQPHVELRERAESDTTALGGMDRKYSAA